MRRRARIATSAACGVAAALLAMGGVQSARADVQRERSELLERYGGEVASLVIARRELASGSVVSESDVEQRDWLADLAPEGAFTSVGDIVGSRLTSPVAKGARSRVCRSPRARETSRCPRAGWPCPSGRASAPESRWTWRVAPGCSSTSRRRRREARVWGRARAWWIVDALVL